LKILPYAVALRDTPSHVIFVPGMDYIKEYRRFINSHYLADGVRITAGVLLPSLVLSYFGYLQTGIFLSLGAICATITDNPGPIHHRRNGLLVCCGIIFLVALAVGYAIPYAWLFMVLLVIFSFFFSMIGVYGARASAIGIAALLMMVMMSHEVLEGGKVWEVALLVLAGGLWYTCLSLLLYSIRPYKLIQQVLGEYVHAASRYLRARSEFYVKDVNMESSYEMMMQAQVDVQKKQELAAELLFKTRSIVRESTHTSRILMMAFLDVSDLIERTMASHLEYKKLHTYFDNTTILSEYRDLILLLANELDEIAISLSSGRTSDYDERIDKRLVEQRERLHQLRLKLINPENLEGFISLRHILDSIDDIAARIRTLHQYTSYDPSLKNIRIDAPEAHRYVARQSIDPDQFWSNFSLRSNIFRHSIRLTVAAVFAYLLGQILSFGHGYWILLTVIVIMKPGYSLSKQRNVERLIGTLIGVGIGWLILFFVKDSTAVFILFIVTMTAGYSFIRWKYPVGVVFITLYLLFMFHILEPGDFNDVIEERVIDTLLGSLIGFLGSFLFPPIWERQQIGKLVQKVVIDIASYFESVATVFTGQPYDREASKLKRKQAWVSLANVSDAFSRMLSEPKSKRRDTREFHRFVVSSHMIVSHMATLSYYADTLRPEYISEDYQPLIDASLTELQSAARLFDNPEYNIPARTGDNPQARLDKKINALMQTRQQELERGQLESDIKRYFSNFKSITDQFYFVYKTSQDLVRISAKIVRSV